MVKFQAAHRLDRLGVVGPATRTALNAVLAADVGATAASPAPASLPTGSNYVFQHFMGVGDDEPDVLELQNRLILLGLLKGPATGYYGPVTETAVKKFQNAHVLTATGYVDSDTRSALNK